MAYYGTQMAREDQSTLHGRYDLRMEGRWFFREK